MQNVWIVTHPAIGGVVRCEYFTAEEAATARVDALAAAAKTDFEVLDGRVELDVTWEQYSQIHDLEWTVDEVPDTASLNSHDDTVDATGPAPSERIWVVLEDGRPEEYRGYVRSEEHARSAAWDRRWARWEYYVTSIESESQSFARYRDEQGDSRYDYAPADPGPAAQA